MLCRRSGDAKVNVRKASLTAIEKICRLDGQNVDEQVTAVSTLPVWLLRDSEFGYSCVWCVSVKTVLSMLHPVHQCWNRDSKCETETNIVTF